MISSQVTVAFLYSIPLFMWWQWLVMCELIDSFDPNFSLANGDVGNLVSIELMFNFLLNLLATSFDRWSSTEHLDSSLRVLLEDVYLICYLKIRKIMYIWIYMCIYIEIYMYI